MRKRRGGGGREKARARRVFFFSPRLSSSYHALGPQRRFHQVRHRHGAREGELCWVVWVMCVCVREGGERAGQGKQIGLSFFFFLSRSPPLLPSLSPSLLTRRALAPFSSVVVADSTPVCWVMAWREGGKGRRKGGGERRGWE